MAGGGCDLACQTKIILNGGNANGIMQANNDVIRKMKDEDFNKLDGKKAIALLNRIENDSVEVQKLLVKAMGYGGPTGKMLE